MKKNTIGSIITNTQIFISLYVIPKNTAAESSKVTQLSNKSL